MPSTNLDGPSGVSRIVPVWHVAQFELKRSLPAATFPPDELVVVAAVVVIGVEVEVDPTVVVTVAGGLPSEV